MEKTKTPRRPSFSEIEKAFFIEATNKHNKLIVLLLNEKHSCTVTNKERR